MFCHIGSHSLQNASWQQLMFDLAPVFAALDVYTDCAGPTLQAYNSCTGTPPLHLLLFYVPCKQASKHAGALASYAVLCLACRFVWGKKIERDLLRGTDVREFTAAAQQRKHEERMVRALSLLGLSVQHKSCSTSWASALQKCRHG